jgi:NTE family protein
MRPALPPWFFARRGPAAARRGIAVAALALVAACLAWAPATRAADAAPEARRPKIGLVLSGGGARGLTHVGVLRVLEEMRIPIDYIAATSMGAIVGGLYASGMSPQAMEKQLVAISWPTLFSDSPPRQDLGFRRKQEAVEFPLAFELGYHDGEFHTFKGALSGSNLELYLHELVRNVDDAKTFDDLPIPYRAVATDMVSGKQIVFDRGPLYKAMRASMSVPGMFAPAEIGGQVLGDGGLVNNLPVDVVRAMGADIVIAVNIGTPLMSRDQLSSVVGLAAQTINILTEQNVREQLKLLGPADILISPDLGKLTFADFTAGPQFIAAGVAAAQAAAPRLAALSTTPSLYAAFQASLLVPAERVPKTLDFVVIEGTHYANPEVLERQMETQPGKPFDVREMHTDLARIYGRGEFEQIDYQLVEEHGSNGLVIDVREKSWGPNYLRFGLSLASDLQGETSFDLLVGHRRVWLNSLGGEWSNELILGRTRSLRTELYQPLAVGQWLFVSAYGLAQRKPEYVFGDNGQRYAEYDVLTDQAGVDLGLPLGQYGEARLGYQYTYLRGDAAIAIPDFLTATNKVSGGRLLLRWDSMDRPFFPRRGVRATGDFFYGSQRQAFGPTDFGRTTGLRGEIDAEAVYPLNRDDTLSVALSAGGVRSERPEVIADFNLGGFLRLSGLRNDQLSGQYEAFGRLVYLHRLGRVPLVGRDFYGGASIEAGNVWNSRSAISGRSTITAGSLFIGADTWLGPFYFAYGRAEGGQSSFYLFLGRP